jgi:hypothetical protein
VQLPISDFPSQIPRIDNDLVIGDCIRIVVDAVVGAITLVVYSGIWLQVIGSGGFSSWKIDDVLCRVKVGLLTGRAGYSPGHNHHRCKQFTKLRFHIEVFGRFDELRHPTIELTPCPVVVNVVVWVIASVAIYQKLVISEKANDSRFHYSPRQYLDVTNPGMAPNVLVKTETV